MILFIDSQEKFTKITFQDTSSSLGSTLKSSQLFGAGLDLEGAQINEPVFNDQQFMTPCDTKNRCSEIRLLITQFLKDRLEKQVKDKKIKEGTSSYLKLERSLQKDVWLADAAKLARGFTFVTHSSKGVHSQSGGAQILVYPASMPKLDELGSHVLSELGDGYALDAASGASYSLVQKFLSITYEGLSFAALALKGDSDFMNALSDDRETAETWAKAFGRTLTPSHRSYVDIFNKQTFWPVGDDLHDDTAYHIIVPLHPCSLAHQVHEIIRDEKFGSLAKAARDAKKAGLWSERKTRSYLNIADNPKGGSKPSNVSSLNQDRSGHNYLLPSLPPKFQTDQEHPLFYEQTIFPRFVKNDAVQSLLFGLRAFLESNPVANVATRNRRDGLVVLLLDELMQLVSFYQDMEPGWSLDGRCKLSDEYRALLDPEAQSVWGFDGNLVDIVASDFADFLNRQLQISIPVGDDEFVHWRGLAQKFFKQEKSFA